MSLLFSSRVSTELYFLMTSIVVLYLSAMVSSVSPSLTIWTWYVMYSSSWAAFKIISLSSSLILVSSSLVGSSLMIVSSSGVFIMSLNLGKSTSTSGGSLFKSSSVISGRFGVIIFSS